jgi:hypothetical protein
MIKKLRLQFVIATPSSKRAIKKAPAIVLAELLQH